TSHSVWAPYESKTMFMLDLLDNLPRLRLSDEHMKTIIWVMKECGTPNVPSFTALRAKQTLLTKDVSIVTGRHTSPLGNVFHANGPAETFRLDFANPLVRPHMHLYPEVASEISEFWQGGRVLGETDYDELQLMWLDFEDRSRRHRHFYIKELARLKDGRFVIPMVWFVKDGVYYANTFAVEYNSETSLYSVNQNKMMEVEARQLEATYLDLKASGYDIKFTVDSPAWTSQMPHPERDPHGCPKFTTFASIWSDDVSGNKTKMYNPHTNVYVANLNLPHRNLQQEYFVRFVSTSPHASSSEQLEAAVNDMGKSKWHKAYDCELEMPILFRIRPKIEPADNPQQAETCSHIGLKGSKFCRRCHVGGTNTEKETDEGFEALFTPGRMRKVAETRSAVKNQLHTAALGVAEAVTKLQRESGVKDKIAQHWIEILIPKARQLQHERIRHAETRDERLKVRALRGEARKEVEMEITLQIQTELVWWLIQQPPDRYAALPQDSPMRRRLRAADEILHTWLLGGKKYVWHAVSSVWDDKTEAIFAARLQSSSVDGLSIPPLRGEYMVKYKNSLLGKHFKALQQVGVFHLYDGVCSDLLLDLWKASGELAAMLWYHTIPDMDQYIADLSILIGNVLDIWTLIDPERILEKAKLHILPHILEDIRNFGPAPLYSTEIFECWNAIFRFCSILSNHQAPSLDIARTLADLERFKHLVSGGWWKGKDGHYTQAGQYVRSFLVNNPKLQQRLGWTEPRQLVVGSTKLCSKKTRAPEAWAVITRQNDVESIDRVVEPSTGAESQGQSQEGVAVPSGNLGSDQRPQAAWQRCQYLISQSRDVCKVGSWVFFNTDSNSEQAVRPGRILDIRSSGSHAVAFIKTFEIAGTPDDRFNMPVLTPSAKGTVVVDPEAIHFIFNAQHDCHSNGCKAGAEEHIRQERETTERTRNSILHATTERFFLNMHAFHNADLIRRTLPRTLWAPKSYVEDRGAKHREAAEKLRVSRPQKRAEAVKKGKETRARNAAKGAAAAAGNNPRPEGESTAAMEGAAVPMDTESSQAITQSNMLLTPSISSEAAAFSAAQVE
ncbi:hypothetical protein EIP91_004346, partial [Steccherinum ochraceum]